MVRVFLHRVCYCALLAMFISCGKGAPEERLPDAVSAASRHIFAADALLTSCMPEAMADGFVKVAIIRNMDVTDHARQFMESCAAEGRAMGFIVDTFVTQGNEERCRSLVAALAGNGYDGFVFSVGENNTYEILAPALESGLKIVTYNALAYIDGDPQRGVLPGVTVTFQDDEALARLSLKAILDHTSRRPARVIRVWFGPGLLPLDRRQLVWDKFAREGLIEEAALISPQDFVFSRSKVKEELNAFLLQMPYGEIDAIWAPYDDFAKGCIDALADFPDSGLLLSSVDISNDDIAMMREHAKIWLGTAAVDASLIGVVTMRILAAKFAGEETPARWNFDACYVETSILDDKINMSNIATVLKKWRSSEGLFDGYPWMIELKAARGEFHDRSGNAYRKERERPR